MKKARILLGIGIWVAVLPYLGFPPSWKTILFTFTGFGIMALSYMLYRENKINLKKRENIKKVDSFLENRDYTQENNVF